MALSNDQQRIFDTFCMGENILITGQAGCGKSYLINAIRTYCEQNRSNCCLTASTGIAATIIGGLTIHSWAGIRKGEDPVPSLLRNMSPAAKERWISARVLVIDEVSMLSAELYDKLEWIARSIRSNQRLFGGIQLVLVGDFAQLPPVEGRFLFQSDRFRDIRKMDLTTPFRQRDPQFFEVLSELRRGVVSLKAMRLLGLRRQPPTEIHGIKPTLLNPMRDMVTKYNFEQLAAISVQTGNAVRKYTAVYPAEREEYMHEVWKRVQAMKVLPIAVGAQVILTKNVHMMGLCNGSRGVVTKLTDHCIGVRFLEHELDVVPENFEVKLTAKKTVIIKQFPLLLGYACTIHKSQGLSLDCVEVDLKSSFDYGMCYVALSRCRTLEHLYIKSIDYEKVKINPLVRSYYGFDTSTA